MVPMLVLAQSSEPTVTVLKSGLQSIHERHALLLTVTEAGSTAAASEVTIEFRDPSDQRRAFTSGVLLRNRPVRLRVTIPAGAGRDQLRAIVKITTNSEGSEPIVGLEDLDVDSLKVETRPPCAPPSVGGGAEGNCDGWRATRLTLDQASRLPD
jgi:hypothetical protein